MQATHFALCVLALIASASAFAPSTPALAGMRTSAISTPKLNRAPRAVATKMSMAPLAEVATTLIAQEVSPAAYMAVILGTFVPVVFLVTLYIQSETRKAGAE
eukprot:CAMPEP_0173385114 /NCGR_PEP_ID=MMETSP1356-20130122/7707_1 /TAXON_ID=77927 ORGANISM="Hemiselmis virescens, Strain PCC157" /NCGR_SAMPLE_ID=MMETSP1356 /ASSEMBLY_ACC=CAM_ASM_000847 /LENGTH=102 /DNA_ID=CAMNT_0014340777 /DNA_START=42 /DNA_END=350 /DNA_ORIENTATION=+